MTGSGSPGALFIHGTASSGRIWAKLLDSCGCSGSGAPLRSLLQGPVFTPDTPGMGKAAAPHGRPLTFQHWLKYFQEIAGEQPVHLIGHSLGGAIAVHLAPEDWVLSVTLIAPATRRYCEERRRGSRDGTNPGSIVFFSPLSRVVSDVRALSRDEVAMLREDYAAAAPLLSAGVPWPPFDKAEEEYLRGKKVLLVYGDDDAVVPARYFEETRANLEGASVDVTVLSLPGCGHIPQIERPSEVACALQAFWTACRND